MPGKHFFMSDLHMFSRRSHFERHEPAVLRAVAQAETFVLGGDIFDFRWSTLPSLDVTIDAGLKWLDSLIQPHPNCEFHYVLGNHDFNQTFMDRLDEFAEAREQFTWHRYYTRMGDCMFLHGDVADGMVSHEELIAARETSHDSKKKWRVQHYLYDMAVHLRAHKAVAASLNRKQKVADRILTYLHDIGHGEANGLRHVYFGHTHVPMANYERGGLLFHNGGSPIKYCHFRILEAEINLSDV